MNVQTIVFFNKNFKKFKRYFWFCEIEIHYKDTDMLIQVHIHLHVDQPKWKSYT